MIFLRFGNFVTTEAKDCRFMGLGNITAAFVLFTALAPHEIYQVKDGSKLTIRQDIDDKIELWPCKIGAMSGTDLMIAEHNQMMLQGEIIKFVRMEGAK
jgi:hypothetical protein